MGSGRFLEVGPVTVRMVLFLLAVSCSVVLLIQKRGINIEIVLLLHLFVVVHAVAFMIGVFNNADMYLMLIDIKPLLFLHRNIK